VKQPAQQLSCGLYSLVFEEVDQVAQCSFIGTKSHGAPKLRFRPDGKCRTSGPSSLSAKAAE